MGTVSAVAEGSAAVGVMLEGCGLAMRVVSVLLGTTGRPVISRARPPLLLLMVRR